MQKCSTRACKKENRPAANMHNIIMNPFDDSGEMLLQATHKLLRSVTETEEARREVVDEE